MLMCRCDLARSLDVACVARHMFFFAYIHVIPFPVHIAPLARVRVVNVREELAHRARDRLFVCVSVKKGRLTLCIWSFNIS